MKMKAIIFNEYGGPEVLKISEVPVPLVNKDEILIKVKCSALNRADCLIRSGLYGKHWETPFVLGAETCGEIVEIGEDCRGFNLGDIVSSITPYGGYAEFIKVRKELVFKLPDELTIQEKAAIPEVFLTAYQLLFWLGEVTKDSIILNHAAGSGIGTTVIQLANIIGAQVINTSRQDYKCEKLNYLGNVKNIVTADQKFSSEVLSLTENLGVNVVLDPIGASYMNENLISLKKNGKLISYGGLGGELATVDLVTLATKWVSIIGTTFQPRTIEYKQKLIDEMLTFCNLHFKRRTLLPIIDKVFSANDIVEAHKYMESNQNFGKIVVEWNN